ncbi:hypothetical protein [Halomicronema sp. CCY15110]|uniref:hypothetical protein n=1 Tax=Halomicronema sp. CCY15110 TaxID=2767773 RepID=UPI0019526689|nr:hypothetical protein [Halomicronema sp. CCY15110]
MLFQAVVFNSAFEPVSGKEESLYNSLCRFLRDVCKSGTILIDDQGEILKQLRLSTQKWNDLENFIEGVQAGSDLNRLLRVLEQKNRLLTTSSEPQDLDCASVSCHKYFEIAQSQKPEFLITDQNCFNCAGDHLSGVEETQVIKIDVYDHNQDFQRWADLRGFCSLEGWTQQDFEEKILIPLFRSTENVFLLDKQMGRYCHNNSGYIATIKWLLNVFKKYSRPPHDGLFELHIHQVQRPDFLHAFEQEMKSLHPGFGVKLNSHYAHDRFLRTDQAEIAIGRGFDLLQDHTAPYPCKIRDTTIAYID